MASRTWEETLWRDLDAMSDVEQIKATGAFITDITHEVLPALARRRRDRIKAVLEQPGWDHTRLAETIGSRSGTIKRLLEEGRAMARADARDEAA